MLGVSLGGHYPACWMFDVPCASTVRTEGLTYLRSPLRGYMYNCVNMYAKKKIYTSAISSNITIVVYSKLVHPIIGEPARQSAECVRYVRVCVVHI